MTGEAASSNAGARGAVYIALLRGINVSGHHVIKMEQLRALFAALKFQQVRTYIQSGNIVFEAEKGSPADMGREIEGRILQDFGFPVLVFLRTAKQIKQVIADNPFSKQAGLDPSKFYITFLSGPAPKPAEEILAALAVTAERFHVNGREIYFYYPNGYGETKLSNPAIEKKLGLSATTRNWKTVNALLALAQS